jgi:hypothetical protein
MLRLLLVSLLAMGLIAQSASAQTPEPTKRSTYVTGTALDLIPEGKPGIIDVIPFGPFTEKDFGLPVVVWNNTEKPAIGLHVFGTIRTASGLLRVAVDSPVYPMTILPGEFGFSVVEFATRMDDRGLDPGNVIAVEYYVPDYWEMPFDSLVIIDAEIQGDRLNGHARIRDGMHTPWVRVVGMCFGADGQAYSGLMVGGGNSDESDQPSEDDIIGITAFWPDAFTPDCDRWLVVAEVAT